MVHILDEIIHVYCFRKRASIFLNILYFFAEKISFKRFENSWAIIQFEMPCVENLPNLAIFRKNQAFFRKKHPFLRKNQNLDVLRFLKHYYNLRRISEFFLNFCVFEKIQRFFWKNPKSKRFENSWVKTQFEADCTSNFST